jgi:phage pi2 protein 07
MKILITTLLCLLITSCASVYTGRILLNEPKFKTREECEAWLAVYPKQKDEQHRFCNHQYAVFFDDVFDRLDGAESGSSIR